MRNFREDPVKERSAFSTVSILGQKFSRRTAYRAILAVGTVVAIIVACITVVLTSGGSTVAGRVVPKALVVVVPGLNPTVLESAMASNKAPNMAMLAAAGGTYDRVAANSSDPTASLISLLTGTPVAFHNVTDASRLSAFYNGAPSLLRYAKTASLRTSVIASEKYFSAGGYLAGSATCATVGLLDQECIGAACPNLDSSSYCSALTKIVLPNDESALMGTTLSTAVQGSLDARELILALVACFEDRRSDDDNSLRALSNVALLDGVVGQLALVLAQRSYQSSENWLLVVAGDGVNAQQQAPLLVAAYAAGAVANLNPINSLNGNVVDVFATVQAWFGVPNPAGVVGIAQGVCRDGSQKVSC